MGDNTEPASAPRAKLASPESFTQLSKESSQILKLWQEKTCPGFAAFPILFDEAKGHIVTDVDGNKYIDLIGQYAVVNFGHGHPRIVKAITEQMQKLALTNTSYVNPLYAQLADRLTKKFGYDCITTMCTGSEATESAVKIARKYAYVRKGVEPDRALFLTVNHCYHGITLATMPLSDIIAANFGKHLPNVGPFSPVDGKLIKFGELDVLTEAFDKHGHEIAGVMIEPVQGVAGTKVAPPGYLKAVQDLCRKHKALFVCDEVQTGMGRTGSDLAFQDFPGVKPDLVTLGKAITGGLYPLSIIMGTKGAMGFLSKGEIASTYAAAPPACAAALAALDILEEEQLSERSREMGEVFVKAVEAENLPYLLDFRGKALARTLVIDESVPGVSARRLAALMACRGVLCGCGGNRLRFAPPLNITEIDLLKAIKIMGQCFREVASLGEFPGSKYIN